MTNVIFNRGFIGFFELGVALCCQHGGTGNRYPLYVGIAKIYICDGGIRRKVDSVSFSRFRADGFGPSLSRPGGPAEGTSRITDEVPDGSLPDALGRPVDHGGGGRCLPSEDHKLKLRIMERVEELKKAGKDPRSVYSKEFLEEIYRDE